MNGSPSIVGLLRAARVTREAVDDFLPTLAVKPHDGDLMYAVVQPQHGLVTDSVDDCLREIHEAHAPLDWVALTLDVYARRSATMPAAGHPLNLGDQFRDGAPDVVEQMLVVLAERGRRGPKITTAHQCYRHTPVDGWEWENPTAPETVVFPDGVRIPQMLAWYLSN